MPGPSELMRARHPDLFSDTLRSEAPILARPIFEYHLDTLTSRKQEYEFEHFCRKLAEKEICPNLRVQTGPTGGGDSKVDTETYPVAVEIAERWWVGEPSAGTERWGFAFSAKKAWKAKLKADVDNILSTGRDYKRIYFFTNQFVSDKDRAQQEDTLSARAGRPIHIIDRAWIVEKVYENSHLDLAISTLGIEGAGSENLKRPGPRDTERLAELEELDGQVSDPTRYNGTRYQLVEDCVRSAILARGLERPRSEIESRFAQADRIAQEVNIRSQRMRLAYNRAWTAFWWFEDYPAFNGYYDEVERLLDGAIEAAEIDRLLNLWQLLAPSVAQGRMADASAKVDTRRERLTAYLQTVADHPTRLNNALQARTGLALVKLTQSYIDGADDARAAVWQELSEIIDQSAPLGNYPIEQLSKLVFELGAHFDEPEFDVFFEKLVDTVHRRRSESEAGEAYSKRGIQKLEQGKPYEAVNWLGRAEELLLKEECRDELVVALIASSYAYERVGLLWAARSKVLAAVDRSLLNLIEDGQIVRPALAALQRLAWIELQLGRIPQVLEVMSLASMAAAHLKLSDQRRERFESEVMLQEAVVGIHLLNVPLAQLSAIRRLPDALQRLGLSNARLAALYALGDNRSILAEEYFPSDQAEDETERFFESWHDQIAKTDIPAQPILIEGTVSTLSSTILGTELHVETPTNPVAFGLAESLLGAIESLLATSDEDNLFPHRERTTLKLRADSDLSGAPEIRFNDEISDQVEIVYPAEMAFATIEEIQGFSTWLHDAVIALVSRLFIVRDIENWMERIGAKERAFSRSFVFGNAIILGENIFGDGRRIQLSDWLAPSDQAYTPIRTSHWRTSVAQAGSPPNSGNSLKKGSGPPPKEMMDRSRLKHTDRRVMSPIDMPLWDRAKWRGTLFATIGNAPPILGVGFKDEVAGQAIFNAWRDLWGEEDIDDRLRVAIIRGISAQNPAEYAVVIGPNLDHWQGSEGETVLTVSRINRMTPNSKENLDRFISSYRRFSAYLLVPAALGTTHDFSVRHFLAKRKLHIREAWQIGENDTDSAALHVDDVPIIPPYVKDPPVLKALARIKQMRG